MEAELKIIDISRFNKINTTVEFKPTEFIPHDCKIVKIQIGNCENSFDLSSFHFRGGHIVELNYTIKVKNLQANDEVLIFWQNQPHKIEQNKNMIVFNVESLEFIFKYKLTILETSIKKVFDNIYNDEKNIKKETEITNINDEKSIKKETEITNINDEKIIKNTSIPIEKQKIHSFLKDDDIEDKLPKVDF